MTTASDLTVLLVEDHEFQRRTMVRMLRSLDVGCVLEAGDGGQALALIDPAAPPQLVLCDLDMPGMDGMELIRHLGQTGSTAAVVIVSAQNDAMLASVEKMARAYGVRLLGSIAKPIGLKQLEDLLSQLLQPAADQAGARPAAAHTFTLAQVHEGLRLAQFEPYFQPKIELVSGRIVGAEALARWQHPQFGLVSPPAFVAVLEQSSRLDELTMLMLERAAACCRDWRARGLPMNVSVNLSQSSLADTTLAYRITEVVHASGLDPHHMILEITETAAASDVAAALENLNRLRMRGFGLSIDDYGTGFASMQQLVRVPFTELKIDAGFVGGWAGNAASRVIVETSIDVARRLGITSVAEGVQSRADLDAMKACGCDLAQGHFIAHPLGARAMLDFCLG